MGAHSGTSSPGPKACDLRLQQSHRTHRPPSSQLPHGLASSSWSQGSWQVLDPSRSQADSPLPPCGHEATPGPPQRPLAPRTGPALGLHSSSQPWAWPGPALSPYEET